MAVIAPLFVCPQPCPIPDPWLCLWPWPPTPPLTLGSNSWLTPTLTIRHNWPLSRSLTQWDHKLSFECLIRKVLTMETWIKKVGSIMCRSDFPLILFCLKPFSLSFYKWTGFSILTSMFLASENVELTFSRFWMDWAMNWSNEMHFEFHIQKTSSSRKSVQITWGRHAVTFFKSNWLNSLLSYLKIFEAFNRRCPSSMTRLTQCRWNWGLY